MILPAFGMSSEIVPVFARKPIFGYMSMVAALFGIVFLSMTVCAHHMFTVGMNTYVEGFFMLMTMLIAVPTGIKFFNWIATAWWGSIEFTFFFSSRRRHTRSLCDWSSDVCSSD